MSIFKLWDDKINEDVEQQKRIKTAQKADTTPTSVDLEAQSAVFKGSGKDDYITTLSNCTCRDFFVRKLPCKHMYRLAMECGLMQSDFTSGKNKNALPKQLSLKEAVAELEKLPNEYQKKLRYILYDNIYHNVPTFETDSLEETQILESCSLITSLGKLDLKSNLDRLKKADILNFLSAKGHKIAANKKKEDIIDYCITNATEIETELPIIYVFTFSDIFNKCKRKVYMYLLRKFDWDKSFADSEHGLYEISYPHGALFEKDPNICYFPDDEITHLLTSYGCNRCLNGFDISKQ